MNSDFLPEVNLTDEQLIRNGWKVEDGWAGLVPGISTLPQIIARFGEPCNQSKLANASCFDFRGGSVRATFLENQNSLFKIWASAKLAEPSLMPATLDDAIAMFGQLKATRIEKTVGIIFERPGLRMACLGTTEPKRVKWIEFYTIRKS